MRAYSAAYKSTLAATSAPEAPLTLLEIDHPALTQPVRVVNDTQDIESNGHLYVACPFRCTLPDDRENQLPEATLAVDNIGGDLMYWIETSGGGQGSTVRIIQVMRSRPDLVELEIAMGLFNVQVTMTEVAGKLGYEDFFNRPAVALRYDPATAPGVF